MPIFHSILFPLSLPPLYLVTLSLTSSFLWVLFRLLSISLLRPYLNFFLSALPNLHNFSPDSPSDAPFKFCRLTLFYLFCVFFSFPLFSLILIRFQRHSIAQICIPFCPKSTNLVSFILNRNVRNSKKELNSNSIQDSQVSRVRTSLFFLIIDSYYFLHFQFRILIFRIFFLPDMLIRSISTIILEFPFFVHKMHSKIFRLRETIRKYQNASNHSDYLGENK